MRRSAVAAALFLPSVLGVAAGIHLYLAERLVLQPAWPAAPRRVLIGALAAAFVLLVAQPFLRRRLSPKASRVITWPAALWLGFAFLLFTATAASDVLLWLLGAAGGSGSTSIVALARARALAVLGLSTAAAVVATRTALEPPPVRRVRIALARWPQALDGFRIVQISDLHIGPLLDRRFAAEVTRRVNVLAPDLVAVTGDLVDGSVRHVGEEVAPLAALHARFGVYFVTGNHDYYSGVRRWVARVRELGWRVLRNERIAIETSEGGFDLAGVDDHHGALFDEGEDLARALSGRDPTRPLVLLAHDPATFRDASARGVDLQLSGHTHGGQIWPFRLLVRLVVPWVSGLHRLGSSVLYVSRGTGFWGPPMRLLAPPEITEIVLTPSG